jgi:hypothetical protein
MAAPASSPTPRIWRGRRLAVGVDEQEKQKNSSGALEEIYEKHLKAVTWRGCSPEARKISRPHGLLPFSPSSRI